MAIPQRVRWHSVSYLFSISVLGARVFHAGGNFDILICGLLFVHPEHRHQGAGRSLMNWGLQKAKELKIEPFVEKLEMKTFIEGFEMEKHLYDYFGVRVSCLDQLRLPTREPSDEWRKMEREFWPMHWYLMCRGDYENGKTVVPREKERQ